MKPELIELKSVGKYTNTLGTWDLSDYYVDRMNNLYSRNLGTWEINRRLGQGMMRMSDDSLRGGNIMNSLKTPSGYKISVDRRHIIFNKLGPDSTVYMVEASENGRKYKILAKEDQ